MSESKAGRLNRTFGLTDTTGVGVGAIVGGGILALAGVAFATTGPSAIVAFAASGLIAVLERLKLCGNGSGFSRIGWHLHLLQEGAFGTGGIHGGLDGLVCFGGGRRFVRPGFRLFCGGQPGTHLSNDGLFPDLFTDVAGMDYRTRRGCHGGLQNLTVLH